MTKQVFSIVVADDEDELREAMCRLIDWKSIGFELLGSAGNGLDALQMVEQLQPDLLLTDIQMPFITGTDLARQVRQIQPLIQVAFLSGYDYFEYAKSAIDSQAISYLLKPISMAELTEALKDIRRKMEERFCAYMPSQESGNLPLAVATLMMDNFSADISESGWRQLLWDCGMIFTDPCEMLILSLTTKGNSPLEQNAAQIIDKTLRQRYNCSSFVSGQWILSLVIAEEGFTDLEDTLDELYYIARRVLNTECTLGVSRLFDRLDRCGIACREAMDAARLADGFGVQHIDYLVAKAEEKIQKEQYQTVQFDRIFFGGRKSEMQEYLSEILGPSTSELIAMQVLIMIKSLLQSALGDDETALLIRRFRLTEPLKEGIDLATFCNRIKELSLAGQERMNQSKQAGISTLVERTMQIIETRYMDEELSLGAVSEELHVSPNYLSANMKKYAGDTFINFLIKKRMEAAKILLHGGSMKIGEVARLCGYSDQHYFSFCFKKYFGLSPARMRQGEEAVT